MWFRQVVAPAFSTRGRELDLGRGLLPLEDPFMPLITQRRRILILPRLQFRLVAAFLSAACISTVVQMLLLNLALTSLANDQPAARGALLEATPDILRTQILLTFGVMVPLVITVGLMETFRIAGPLYRIEQYLKAVIAGGRPAPCTLRQDDELHDLCRLVNTATQSASQAASASASREPPAPVPSRPAPAAFVLD